METGRTLLVDQAEACAEADPLMASDLLIEVGIADLFSGDSTLWLSTAGRAEALARLGGDEERALFARLAGALAITPLGEGRLAEPDMLAALPLLLEGDPLPAASELVTFAGQQFMWLERFDLAEQVLSRRSRRRARPARSGAWSSRSPRARSCTIARAAGPPRSPRPPRQSRSRGRPASRSRWRSR
jgi:hypothetical protein